MAVSERHQATLDVSSLLTDGTQLIGGEWVAARGGEPIRKRIQGPDARVTFWCPRCQPMPDGSEIDG